MQTPSRQPPVVVETYKVLRTDGLFGTELFWQLSRGPQIPPVRVCDQTGGSPESPRPIQPSALRLQHLEAFVWLQQDEVQLRLITEDLPRDETREFCFKPTARNILPDTDTNSPATPDSSDTAMS